MVYSRIIITGGNGMLAHALSRALARRGVDAVRLSRDECDIAKDADREAIFSRYRPTLLLNCAAHTKVDLCETETEKANLINGHAPGLLAAKCNEHGVKLVHYSTDFVFAGTAERAYREDDPVGPLSAYGKSKLMGEEAIRHVDPPGYLILRTAWLYGRPGACFPRTMVNAARAGKALTVVSDQRGTPTLTDDLAAAALELVDRDASGLFHVTNGGATNWFEFTQAIMEEFGVTAEVAPIFRAEWKKRRPESAHRPGNSRLDVGKVEKAIGRKMRDWREALHDYRDQVEAQGF
jgi:dTDP-4-dehydrorhamnose reductase